MATFPQSRLRRLRATETIRGLVRETLLKPSDFVYPMFVCHGRGVKTPIVPMPGCYQLSIDQLLHEVQEVAELGVSAVLLFGIPERKDALGSEAYDPLGVIQKAIRAIKRSTPHMLIISDVCLCEYTDHGHCGVVTGRQVDNDKTLSLLVSTAISHAEAGVDVVAPSAMMDGQVMAIRQGLDGAGYNDTPIMAYAAKYASAFYGPFRVAAESTPQFGDRMGYQLDPGNVRMAIREVEQDIHEGADIVMVKPALPYLDVIAKIKERFQHPVAAYNVSGEFSMVKAATSLGWLDEKKVTIETLTGIKRAGADIIISYHAKDACRWLLAEK